MTPKVFDTIQNVKQLVAKEFGIPGDQQHLIYAGRVLEDGKSLSDYNILRDTTLGLILKKRGD